MARRLRGRLADTALALGAVLLTLVLVEGMASAVLLARDLLGAGVRPAMAERLHTRYDAELGWVNVPGASIADLYGPGADLRINAQGFRSDRDTPREAPPGGVRVVCSGDSFTLGYGVANHETWCARLELPGRDVETVNMGQGGYGIGQAWLWYRRDGSSLEHHLHVFAFIYPDFERMTEVSFLGYAKPRVRLVDGSLVVENVPTPRAGPLHGWLRRHRRTLGSLRVFELLRPLVAHPPRRSDGDLRPYDLGDAVAASLAIFQQVARDNARRGSVALFVYLPTEFDFGPRAAELAGFRERLAREMSRRSLRFVDLTDRLEALEPEARAGLFFPPGASRFRFAKGHYTPAGHALVAREISRHLARRLEAGA